MSVFKEVGNNRKYTDSYILFKKNTENQEKEERDVNPSEYAFKACDYIDYYEEQAQDGYVSMRVIKHLTIITPTRLNFQIGDMIESLKDKAQWRINKITIKDDNKGKDKSLRPKKLTILELVG